MIALPGYQITAKIYESANSLIYRCIRLRDRQPVVLKILKQDYLSPNELARYKQEYEVTHSLNIDGVVKALGVEKYQNTLAIVFEDCGGDSLLNLMAKKQLSLEEFLSLAVRIAEIIGEIHAANIIHQNINPSNLMFNPETGQVKLIDFGISTVLSQGSMGIVNTNFLEGNLTYISPEQTGRMNQAVDYRTDFYSLGVTLYEMLLQQTPFAAADPMELVHCHIAKQPTPPWELNPQIPKVISDIVMKLLAKTPEERYQSAWGIQADLVLCLMQLEANDYIEDFQPGENDVSNRFQIPQKLYGREAEIGVLIAALQRIFEGNKEMMLVSGYSGIGKSSLVREICQPVFCQQGYFTFGNCDRFQRNVPYSGLTTALVGLIRQLLAESESRLQQWRDKLTAAMGADRYLLAETIPEMRFLIGESDADNGEEKPSNEDLTASGTVAIARNETKAESRFDLAFQNAIRVFCHESHPLVIFLDDLQWADVATLKLVERMLADEDTQHLLIVGAYRDRDMPADHLLWGAIDTLKRQGVAVNHLSLPPLKLDAVSQLIADTLDSDLDTVRPLAQLVLRKTSGNPFFIVQFLQTLYAEHLLGFDFECLSWQWDIAQIEAMDITDNAVDLMVDKLRKLPEATQTVLQLAACVGSRFDLKTLAFLQQVSLVEAFRRLLPALQEGLVQASAAELHASESENQDVGAIGTPPPAMNFEFLHNRVQQAADALISEEQKREIHIQMGQYLLHHLPARERSERIFEIVDHLNRGRSCLAEAERVVELARLNLEAARKARETTAYAAALEYLVASMEGLPETLWDTHGDLALALHQERAEVESLNGNLEATEYWVQYTLPRAASPLAKANLYKLLVLQYALETQYDRATEVGCEALALLGIDLSQEVRATALARELADLRDRLGTQPVTWLLAEPRLEDPTIEVALDLLSGVATASYKSDRDLWLLTVATSVNLGLKHGQSQKLAYAYVCYGIILGSVFGEYHRGYEFGMLARKLGQRYGDRAQICVACAVIASALIPWVRPLAEANPMFEEGQRAGSTSGNLLFAGYAWQHQMRHLFYQGERLEQIQTTMARSLPFAQRTRNQWAVDGITAMQLIVANLRAETANILDFSTTDLSEADFFDTCDRHRSFAALGTYRVAKAQVLYLSDRFDLAQQELEFADPLLNFVPGTLTVVAHRFYSALVLAALHLPSPIRSEPLPSPLPPASTRYLLTSIEPYLQQLRHWASQCPENFQHQCSLVEAELARLRGEDLNAMEAYDRAIAQAAVGGFVQDEALANERAALFWLARGKVDFAKLYLVRAVSGYRYWGAEAKVATLEYQYPQLLAKDPILSRMSSPSPPPPTPKRHRHWNSFDLDAAIKASQAISGEIVLDRLLEKLMHLVITNAGAQRGLLILDSGGQLTVEAEGTMDLDAALAHLQCDAIVQQTPVEQMGDRLPVSVVNYVARTLENVVAGTKVLSFQFGSDPYLQRYRPKSILCTPILNQGKLIGVLYLENHLTADAFTRDRLEILRLLCSQAAISLENAQLYRNLQRSETRERDKAGELKQSLQQLQEAQVKLVQSEKMSTLGQLVAGVAHEINNPVAFIAGNLGHAQGYIRDLLHLVELFQTCYPEAHPEIDRAIEDVDLPFLMEDLPQLIASMNEGTQRIRALCNSLRTFSRGDTARKVLFDIHDGIESTLVILKHKLKANKNRPEIEVVRNYGDLPDLCCYPGQLNQVFMNLIVNAIDALDEGTQERNYRQIEACPNRITITTELRSDENWVAVRILDNGSGMSEEVRQRVFDHLFTTKAVGKGTGLGLSISRQIVVERHGGKIYCYSTPGQGTEFVVELPVN